MKLLNFNELKIWIIESNQELKRKSQTEAIKKKLENIKTKELLQKLISFKLILISRYMLLVLMLLMLALE